MRYTPIVILCLFISAAHAAPLNIANTPLFVSQTLPPMTMLVMGRDHKLYYEAYNDASDLNGDGQIDIGYKPSINYYGYFDSYKCYSYNSSSGRFDPISVTSTKKCSGAWSGDFLNYLTTARIDALRKTLYGGYRTVDSTTSTVLERSYIPQDAHCWGKEYRNSSTAGYAISDYTPLSEPSANKYHLFTNVTLSSGSEPLLRVASNVSYRIWEWASIERPVCGSEVAASNTNNRVDISSSITDYSVRVKVCDSSIGLEKNCRSYGSGNYKPIGLLQEFGENGAMQFGLITGSYGKNLSGGVLRKNVGLITDEIDANTGQFTSVVGIIKTLDRLRIIGFNSSYVHNSNCGFILDRDMQEGECRMWGNPIAEMMYEAVRYFAGKGQPTSSFVYSSGDDVTLGLPLANWTNPYAAGNNHWCTQANMLVISDVTPSYDTDQIPGSAFSSFTGDLSPALNASSLAQTIWSNENASSRLHYIGESNGVNDGTPSAKTVSSFANIRGISPEEPNKQGGYYAGSVAYYAWLNDINPAQNKQSVTTYSLALASPLPKITIPVDGKIITLIPFAKSVGPAAGCVGNGINPLPGFFQPTNTIVDFYVESLTPTSGTFRINYEDAQQGADHDMDAVVEYSYQVNGDNSVTINLSSTYAAGCIIQHIGYVISGTTADGVYLEVRDRDTTVINDVIYFLDTPPGMDPGTRLVGSNILSPQKLPLQAVRTFTPSDAPAATLLADPLWYAAKWGSFVDKNNNNIPDSNDEFDLDQNGQPDNYFLVTNALTLNEQLQTVLDNITERNSSASAAAINAGTLNDDTRIYQAIFNSKDWSGQLLAFAIDSTTGQIIAQGTGPNGALWDAGAVLDAQDFSNGRVILTFKPSNQSGIPFRWPGNEASPGNSELDLSQVAALNYNIITASSDGLGELRLNYLRGDDAQEQNQGGNFRNRTSRLGDIINSNPLFVGRPLFQYTNDFPTGSAENSTNYSSFRSTHANRTPIIYVGSNNGVVHGFDANTGAEKLAYIPSALYGNLSRLTSPDYEHRYFADGSPNSGDVFFNGAWHTVLVGGLNAGGQGIYALNITNPANFVELQANNIVLWEFTDANDADLGLTYSQPALARLANGKWAAIFGNGVNNTQTDAYTSTTGNAVLYVVDIETGTLIKKLDTGVGLSADPLSSARPNGLATPTVVDTNGDYVADRIYAGDLYGNVWRFDISDSDPNNWQIALSGQPLFTAQSDSNDITTRQAITSRIDVKRVSQEIGSYQLFFGTGKYIESQDKTSTHLETFYSIIDKNQAIADRSSLLEQTILQESTMTDADGNSTSYRVTSANTLTNSHNGWYMDLIYNNVAVGERVASSPIFRNSKIVFSTLIPSDDSCDFGGTGWLMEVNARDGSRLDDSPFDLNNDKEFTEEDKINYVNNGNTSQVAVSGKKSTVGIIPSPGILVKDDVEYKYLPGTSGNIDTVTENPGSNTTGRQSWRQLR